MIRHGRSTWSSPLANTELCSSSLITMRPPRVLLSTSSCGRDQHTSRSTLSVPRFRGTAGRTKIHKGRHPTNLNPPSQSINPDTKMEKSNVSSRILYNPYSERTRGKIYQFFWSEYPLVSTSSRVSQTWLRLPLLFSPVQSSRAFPPSTPYRSQRYPSPGFPDHGSPSCWSSAPLD